MIWEKNHKVITTFTVDLVLLMLAYGGFFREGFSGDAIGQKIWPLTNIEPQIMNGRLLSYALMKLLHDLGINPVYHYKSFYLAFIVIMALTMTVVQSVFYEVLIRGKEDSEQETVLKKLAMFTVVPLVYINGLFCENFMFPEWFLTFSLSYFICAIALVFVARGRFVITGLLMFAAALFYQAQLIPTAIMAATIFLIQNRGRADIRVVRKSFFMMLFSVAVILVVVRLGSIVHLLYPVQAISGKEVVATDIGLTIVNLFRAAGLYLRSGFGLLPPLYLPLVVLLVPIPIVLSAKDDPEKGKKVLMYVMTAIVFHGFSFVIIANRNAIAPTGRLLGGVYTAMAMLLIFTIFLCKQSARQKVIVCLGAAFLVIQTMFCNTIMMNHYISNTLDLNYAADVYEQIRHYEAMTGEKITAIAYTRDRVCMDSYDNVYYKFGEINRRTIHDHGWILVSYAAREDGRSFERVEMDEAIRQELFEGKDWDSFIAQEQLVFRENTLYWCVY